VRVETMGPPKMSNCREISVSSDHDQSHYLHPHSYQAVRAGSLPGQGTAPPPQPSHSLRALHLCSVWQLAALWALNLEQEQEYQAKVELPPGGPRFQKFMEEFQAQQDAGQPPPTAAAAAAAPVVAAAASGSHEAVALRGWAAAPSTLRRLSAQGVAVRMRAQL
jgi:hypothetical protein